MFEKEWEYWDSNFSSIDYHRLNRRLRYMMNVGCLRHSWSLRLPRWPLRIFVNSVMAIQTARRWRVTWPCDQFWKINFFFVYSEFLNLWLLELDLWHNRWAHHLRDLRHIHNLNFSTNIVTLNLTLTDVFAAGDLDGTLEKIFAASGFPGHFRFG